MKGNSKSRQFLNSIKCIVETNIVSDMDFRTGVECMAALAFIPVSDLIPAYESLSTTFLTDELLQRIGGATLGS